jgi:hypothetical protein
MKVGIDEQHGAGGSDDADSETEGGSSSMAKLFSQTQSQSTQLSMHADDEVRAEIGKFVYPRIDVCLHTACEAPAW